MVWSCNLLLIKVIASTWIPFFWIPAIHTGYLEAVQYGMLALQHKVGFVRTARP
jgi:hypothetical protein